MAHEPTKLVLGRGEVYFDRFRPGTRVGEGERYLGNTTSFRIEREVRTQERATSYGGRKVMRDPLVVYESHKIDFTTDNVDLENVAYWFGDSAVDQALTSSGITESFVVKRGRYYQLGKSQNFAGSRYLSEVAVKVLGFVVPPAGNYQVDLTLGRIYVEPNAPDIPDNATMLVDFAIRPSDAAQTSSKAHRLQGSLRFIAFNQGEQKDVFIPFVVLSPRGQVDLKGDQWQLWNFEAEAYNLNTRTEQVYVTRAPKVTQTTAGEDAVVTEFGDYTTFVLAEDEFQGIVNNNWPPAINGES